MRLRFVQFASGSGAGESALGAALASVLVGRGHAVSAFVEGAANAALFRAAGAEVHHGWPVDIGPTLRADAVILSSSLTCGSWAVRLGGIPAPIFTTEHTWMPWIRPTDGWVAANLHTAFVFMPPSVFEAGRTENGGPFTLPDFAASRCQPVGWAFDTTPSESERGGVFCYLGQSGGGTRSSMSRALLDALGFALTSRPDLRIRTAGALPPGAIPSGVDHLGEWLEPEAFASEVRRARVVLAHAAAATMQRALLAGTHVIAVTSADSLRAAHATADVWAEREAAIWSSTGLVHHAFATLPAATLGTFIVDVLGRPPPAPAEGGGAVAAAVAMESIVEERRAFPQ